MNNKRIGDSTYVPSKFKFKIRKDVRTKVDARGIEVQINIYVMPDTLRVTKQIFSLLAKLSPTALRILDYISNKVNYNDLTIVLNATILAEKFDVKRETVSRGISELVDAEFLTKTIDDIEDEDKKLCSPKRYTFNANYLYFGSIEELDAKVQHSIKEENSKDLLVYSK